jgi:hypothetical protein
VQSKPYCYFRAVHIGLIKKYRKSGTDVHPISIARERILLAGTRWMEYAESRHKLPLVDDMWKAQNEKWGRSDSVPTYKVPPLLASSFHA